ncbi:MAG: HAMP domain-containing protein [Oscillospiraceae bacterium]|nr:HAMP domain-containing protein [Oscillospiraceae bacterium]
MNKKKRTLKLRLTLLSIVPVLAACLILVIAYVIVTYGKYMSMYESEGNAVSKAYASSVDYTVSTLSQQFGEVDETAIDFSDLIKNVHYEEDGIAFIIDKTGVVVATSTNLVPKQTGLAGNHGLGSSITKAVGEILKGSEGNVRFKLSGTDYTASYVQIGSVEGWYVVSATSVSPIKASIVKAVILILMISLLSTLTAVVVTGARIKNIAGPVAATAQRMQDMAAGDVSTPAQVFKTNDEIETMSEAAHTLTSNMNSIINDLASVLDSVAHGDLTARTRVEYPGDFGRIKESIERILGSLNQIMYGVGTSSTDVLTGSVQIAEGSQSLAEGTTRQASAIEEISATIQDVSTQIATTADNAAQAGELSERTQEKVNYQDAEIQNMVNAMNEISNTSNEIEKIIKTIEDIAFQTNILALNAAVEAARAGAAGKGFAVVADEVRNLANKSQEAAKSTSDLITASISAVGKGSEIAAATADSMKEVKEMSSQTAKLIVEIASASQEQSESIKQITAGVEQISQVIQTNAATAEETSALCASLNGQSKQLQDQVAHFKTNQ